MVLMLAPPTCSAVDAFMVGAVAVPVNVGDAHGAYMVLMLAPPTCRAVDAFMVGAVAVPVNVGDANSA